LIRVVSRITAMSVALVASLFSAMFRNVFMVLVCSSTPQVHAEVVEVLTSLNRGSMKFLAQLEVGTPSQWQQVQVDSGSDLLWLASPSCKAYGAPNEKSTAVDGVCIDIPDSRLPNGKIGYDNNNSTSAEVLIDFLYRVGYGTGASMITTCGLANILGQNRPSNVDFIQVSHKVDQPGYEFSEAAAETLLCCNETAGAIDILNRFPEIRDDRCPLIVAFGENSSFGYGGPIIKDKVKGFENPVMLQQTESEPNDNNVGTCNFPANGILGLGRLSQTAASSGIREVSFLMASKKIYINEPPPNGSYSGDMVQLASVSIGGSTFWKANVFGISTSDGKITLATPKDLQQKVIAQIPSFQTDSFWFPDGSTANVSDFTSGLPSYFDSGNSMIQVPFPIVDLIKKLYPDACEAVDKGVLFNVFLQGPLHTEIRAKISIPFENVFGVFDKSDCQSIDYDSVLWPSSTSFGVCFGAPSFPSFVATLNYTSSKLSIAQSSENLLPFDFKVACPTPTPPPPPPAPPFPWTWAFLGVVACGVLVCLLAWLCCRTKAHTYSPLVGPSS